MVKIVLLPMQRFSQVDHAMTEMLLQLATSMMPNAHVKEVQLVLVLMKHLQVKQQIKISISQDGPM